MPNETVTDATASAPSTDDSLLSSPDGGAPQVNEGNASGDNDSSGDLEVATGGQPTAAQATTTQKTDDGTATTENGGKSPQQSFQELREIAEKEKAARIAAEAKIALLEKSPVSSSDNQSLEIPTGEDGEPLFKDITTMTAAEVREWQEDDPIGFAKNLEEMTLFRISQKAHQSQQAEIRKATVAEISKTFDEYAKDNPDFNEMWEKGELQAYMTANPGNNAISAHMKLTEQKRIDAAVAKAVKETEERVIKNFQAKRNATVIDAGTVSRTAGEDGIDPALKNTKQFGGLTSVLANKLAEGRRRAAGGL
jgi:hypothetical protein